MENSELINRYIYAVTKNMKPAARKDVADELMSIIQDMLEERCGDVVPAERDVRVVLEELGKPYELSQKYDTDSKDCLIGQPYYGTYKYVMKIVLPCVAGGMFIAQAVSAIADSKIWYEAVAGIIAGIVGGCFSAFAFITLLFAIFYKKDIKMEGIGDSIDNLPPVPEKRNTIPKAEAIGGIVVSVVFTIIFLVCPQIVCAFWTENDATVWVPVFNLEYIKSTWYVIILFAILGITKESMKLLEGKYTKRLMLVTIAANIIDIALTYVWLINDEILNPELYTAINHLLGEEVQFISRAFYNANKIFLGIVIFALLLNTGEIIIKTLRRSN